jgi:hypothetical protein
MENQRKFKQSILGVGLATALLLMLPLIAMQFTNEVDWSPFDFMVMGALLFGTGVSFVVVISFATNLIHKAAIAMAVGSTFFLIWANLAVGLIGGGPNLGNLMYLGVIAVIIIGSIRVGFSASGMEKVMYLTAGTLVLVAAIALITGMDQYPGSSVNEIIGVNGMFALLFAIAGSLFHYAGRVPSTEKSKA